MRFERHSADSNGEGLLLFAYIRVIQRRASY
jgi:hypothetical protein